MNFGIFKKKAVLYSFLGILFVAVAAGAAYMYVSSTPEYALSSAGQAFREKDWEEFNRYVDIDSVLGTSADTLVEEYIRQSSMTESQIKLARSTIKFVRPQIISFFKELLVSQFFTISSEETNPSTEATSPSKGEVGNLKLQSMESVPIDDENTIVTILLHSSSHQEERRIKIKMTKEDNQWQAIEILNLPDVLKWSEVKNALSH